MYCISRLHHLRPFPLFFPSDKEERHSYLPAQEVWGQETLEKMGMLLQGPTLFIDGGTKSPPIQILNKESSRIPEFTACHTTRYDLPLPHDLIHHDARISIINLPAVLTHLNFQRGSKYRKASQLLPFKV